MKIAVFLGPTLAVDEARAELDALYLPPAAQGDVLRVARGQPWAIGIVDGYFERIPAIWHKEILWAMSRGIHVFGSASMGALRAVELEMFGMEGVGKVFADFRSGKLEDDDEVVLIHGPEESGYRPLSEAMVNVRYTLEAAQQAGIIGPSTRQTMVEIAKARHYPERSYTAILEQARGRADLAAGEIAALAAWLPAGRVDQKREDALAMLHLIKSRRSSQPEAKQVRFTFQHTDAWAALYRGVPAGDPAATDSESSAEWLEELRLEGAEIYRQAREQAWARVLGLELAARRGEEAVDRAVLPDIVATFCHDHGLSGPEELERWLGERDMSYDEFLRSMEDEARLQKVRLLHRSRLAPCWWAQLRLSDGHQRLAARARAKRRRLAAKGLESPGLADVDLEEPDLWRWYFEERLGRPVPADLEYYARSLDLVGEDALRRAVLRELCHLRLEQGDNRS